jgi:uncharacterized membrane protein (UPF0127 family)
VTRARRATAVAVGVVLGVAVVVLGTVWLARLGDDDSGTDARGDRASIVRGVTEATAPFGGYSAGTISVGDRDLRVVVADEAGERSTGLRGRVDASPYDGMLFVFDGDTTTAFTMSGVPAPLDIAFFSGDGHRVDRLAMKPCTGSDATCPAYRSSGSFRYALETAAGSLPTGRLRMRVTEQS